MAAAASISESVVTQAMHFKDGRTVKTLKAENKEVAAWLPDRNSGSYQAIIDYMKYLLGVSTSRVPYPDSPTPEELSVLPQITPESILADSTVFSLNLPPPSISKKITHRPRQKSCWLIYKEYFLSDMSQLLIPRATLAWESRDCRWNQIMLALLLKHWRWAQVHGAFSLYGADPKYFSDAIVRAVMERWLRGQKTKSEVYYIRKKKTQRRATIFRYRQEALEELVEAENPHLLSTALDFLPDAVCCSDTEDDGPGQTRAVGMVWRSPEYQEFLHLLDKLSFKQQKALHGARWAALRLDMRRRPAVRVSTSGKAPRNLPLNCYCPSWRDSFQDTKKYLLTQKSFSPALGVLTCMIRAALS
ncbi:uncharacterized protein MELLADRAFT_95983 [Melampsora larici-populina 98AG31]|uniref:Uncharacterized protein n=1 Tax=Melampsora larici-populina (strain 98AG31 / pathotype 3-4-7) TaxID=747676 RepID=F4RDZ8_MELLP|nr:uncharacterized protein MELLADRAFT_95983 [Melampsora larici-populina 98AG31]EGG09494.1 hypothetical protein MELLADRAFT_95983 [Melampsora larici-populina 98AG31]